jgi:hypothetical protein
MLKLDTHHAHNPHLNESVEAIIKRARAQRSEVVFGLIRGAISAVASRKRGPGETSEIKA